MQMIQSNTHSKKRPSKRAGWRVSFALLLGLVGLVPSAWASDWIYTVRPGDQLWNLAQDYCGTHTRWRDLAAHNNLANPNALRPGARLRFPLAWLTRGPAEVELTYSKGDVQLVRAAATTDTGARANTEAAAVGAKIASGDRLLTAAESFASVRFADSSQMNIGPESEVVFDTLTSYGDTGMVDTRVRVVRGGVESKVTPQVGPGAVYHIGTPLGVAAVRGTNFRTRALSDTSFVEMTEGEVEFAATAGDKLDVTQGNGLVASPQGVSVETLLDAPRFLTSAAEISTQRPLVWQPVPGAVGYLVSVAAAASPTRNLFEQRLAATEFAPAGIGPGGYLVKVRGVAANGLEGIEGAFETKVSFTLGVPQNVRATRLPAGRSLRVTWDPVPQATAYEVQMRSVATGKVQTHTGSAESAVLEVGDGGVYEIQVVALAANTRGEASAPLEHRVARRSWWPLLLGALAAVAIAV